MEYEDVTGPNIDEVKWDLINEKRAALAESTGLKILDIWKRNSYKVHNDPFWGLARDTETTSDYHTDDNGELVPDLYWRDESHQDVLLSRENKSISGIHNPDLHLGPHKLSVEEAERIARKMAEDSSRFHAVYPTEISSMKEAMHPENVEKLISRIMKNFNEEREVVEGLSEDEKQDSINYYSWLYAPAGLELDADHSSGRLPDDSYNLIKKASTDPNLVVLTGRVVTFGISDPPESKYWAVARKPQAEDNEAGPDENK